MIQPIECINHLSSDIIYNGDFKDELEYWFLGGQYCRYEFIPAERYNILRIDVFNETSEIRDYRISRY